MRTIKDACKQVAELVNGLDEDGFPTSEPGLSDAESDFDVYTFEIYIC